MRCLNAAMVVFVLCAAANAHADYAAGFAAYDRGDHVTAFKEWKQSAEQGDAKSQYELALLYQDGIGTRKDIAEAIKWYREAAARGLAAAQNNLGVLYSKGLGVGQDHAEAAKWYYKAAKGGSLEALFSLGLAFEKGRGVEQDYNVAALNYLEAAEHGYASAQANLSILYAANVPGVPIDYALAYKWSSLAIPALNGEIQKRVIRHRDAVAAKLTPVEREKMDQAIRDWKPKPTSSPLSVPQSVKPSSPRLLPNEREPRRALGIKKELAVLRLSPCHTRSRGLKNRTKLI